jgi:hypothetical protein
VNSKSVLKVAAGVVGVVYAAWRQREMRREQYGEAMWQRADRRKAARAAGTEPVPVTRTAFDKNPAASYDTQDVGTGSTGSSYSPTPTSGGMAQNPWTTQSGEGTVNPPIINSPVSQPPYSNPPPRPLPPIQYGNNQ